MKNKKLIYQLKITLKNSKPPIWRRVLVENTATLEDLHLIIQAVMESWDGSHLHAFIIQGEEYGQQNNDSDMENDESDFTLSEILGQDVRKFSYTYDFGDDWEHQIVIEKILNSRPDQTYPVCIAGKRACPPEDTGGIWWYGDFVDVFQDPKHKNYKAMKERYGYDFDPEKFSPDTANQALRSIFGK